MTKVQFTCYHPLDSDFRAQTWATRKLPAEDADFLTKYQADPNC